MILFLHDTDDDGEIILPFDTDEGLPPLSAFFDLPRCIDPDHDTLDGGDDLDPDEDAWLIRLALDAEEMAGAAETRARRPRMAGTLVPWQIRPAMQLSLPF